MKQVYDIQAVSIRAPSYIHDGSTLDVHDEYYMDIHHGYNMDIHKKSYQHPSWRWMSGGAMDVVWTSNGCFVPCG
jgi:hypothetical protein